MSFPFTLALRALAFRLCRPGRARRLLLTHLPWRGSDFAERARLLLYSLSHLLLLLSTLLCGLSLRFGLLLHGGALRGNCLLALGLSLRPLI